eukprot:scaffold783_cov112-Isochrysis_galbana.AAC.2
MGGAGLVEKNLDVHASCLNGGATQGNHLKGKEGGGGVCGTRTDEPLLKKERTEGGWSFPPPSPLFSVCEQCVCSDDACESARRGRAVGVNVRDGRCEWASRIVNIPQEAARLCERARPRRGRKNSRHGTDSVNGRAVSVKGTMTV